MLRRLEGLEELEGSESWGGLSLFGGEGGSYWGVGFECLWGGCFWMGGRGAYLEGYLPARFAVFTNRRTRA